MTSKGTKVRVVRCPKCRQLLPELADVPVYACGGCGAVLRAKNHKENGKSVSSAALEMNPSQKNELEHDFGDKKSFSSNQIENSCATEEYSSDLNNRREQIESGNCVAEWSGSGNFSNGISSGDFDCHQQGESLPKIGTDIEVGGNNGRGSNFRSQSPDNQMYSDESTIVIAQRQSDESNSLKIGYSSLNKQLVQSEKNFRHDSGHKSSIDTVETTEPIDHSIISEDLSGALGDFSKSPTNRSSHAYDGSVSSYDGSEDQVLDQLPQLSERTSFKPRMVTDFPVTKGKPTMNDVLVNSKMSTSSEVQPQVRKFLSTSSGEKNGPAVMGDLNWDRDNLHEPTRYGIRAQEQVRALDPEGFHPVRNLMRLARDGFQSREPFYQRGSTTVYEKGSSSNYGHEEFLHSSSTYSPNKLKYFEKMELLRKLDELREQLNRSYNQRGNVNGRFPAGGTQQDKQWPLHCNYEQVDREVLQHYDANYARNPPGAYRPRKTGYQKCGFSHMPFSGQATNCMHHADYSCFHCYPEDWQCQVQMPPPNMCYNKGPCRGHPGHMCYESHSSSSASSQKHLDSSFPPRGCNTQSHDQGHADHDVQKMYHRDRRQPVKRHCRPIAGGAPFIRCYSCWKLLQLPADFLLSKKRFHQLKCGACSEVLKFSLWSCTHIIPYNSNQIEIPPSEVDSSSNATTRRNLALASHANDSLQGDPASYSEDCELSFSKSCSTEGDPAFFTPSSSFAKPMIERKNKSVLKYSGYKYKNSMEASEYASVSSNVAKLENSILEVEEVPRRTGSPLHRLMGYSSPSEMVYGFGPGAYTRNDPKRNLQKWD